VLSLSLKFNPDVIFVEETFIDLTLGGFLLLPGTLLKLKTDVLEDFISPNGELIFLYYYQIVLSLTLI
jgi:hypothetical protein